MGKKIVFSKTVDTFTLDTNICANDLLQGSGKSYRATVTEPHFEDICRKIVTSKSEIALYSAPVLMGFIRAIESNDFAKVRMDHEAGNRSKLFISVTPAEHYSVLHFRTTYILDDFNADKVSDVNVRFKIELYHDKATGKAGVKKPTGSHRITF